jgi:hypothetical protein
MAVEPMMRADPANEFFVGIALGCTQTIIHVYNMEINLQCTRYGNATVEKGHTIHTTTDCNNA